MTKDMKIDSAKQNPATPGQDAPEGTAEKAPPLNAREEWAEFLKTAMIAVVLALLIRTFFYEPFNIPSSSMKPTLEIGDYLFVNKPAYGYSRHSFPFSLAPIDGRIMTGGDMPLRGDVVVFKLPTNTRIDFIKRVIGLPGDTIQMIDGRLYLNRKIVPRETVGLKEVREGNVTQVLNEYIQTLPEGAMFSIYEESDNGPLDNTEEFVVPPGHYFMMGDNRDNSQDSRVQNAVGYVPYENFVGRAAFIFFSTNGSANIGEVWKWPWAIRYGRIFDTIAPVRPPEAKKPADSASLVKDAHAAPAP